MPYKKINLDPETLEQFQLWNEDTDRLTEYYSGDLNSGILYIGPHYGPRYTIDSWKNGFGCMSFDEHKACMVPVELCDPPFNIPLLHGGLDDDIGFFVNEIPLTIRQIVEPVKVHRALILKYIRSNYRTAQLLTSNPALFLILMHEISVGNISFARGLDLAFRRRREIAGACGCPPTECTVKTLGRMDTAVCWERASLHSLCQISRDPKIMTALRHFPTIPEPLVNLLVQWPDLVCCSFFRKDREFYRSISDTDQGEKQVHDLLSLREDIKRMAKYLDMEYIDTRFHRMDAVSTVQNFHDHLINRLNVTLYSDTGRQYVQENAGEPLFPKPPLMGNRCIVPIMTAQELVKEGYEMKHCVGSLIESVRNGECFIYRVLHPERCTVSITTNEYGITIGEIRGKCNKGVSPTMIKLVNRWMRDELAAKWETIPDMEF